MQKELLAIMALNTRVLILLLFASQWLYAQTNAPKYSNEFLAIGVGARALGMGNSQVAISDDVTASYWNPAGLLNITTKYEASFMHAEYFAGIANYDYLGFATRLDEQSVLAISLIRFAVDDIPDTRFLFDANGAINYGNVKFFSAADYALLLSYARRLDHLAGIHVGGNAKIIHRSVGEFASAWGFGFDLGAQKTINNWRFGLSARDITSTFNAWSHNPNMVTDIYNVTGNTIPLNSIEITLPRLILGAARQLTFSEKIGLLVSADMEWTFDGARNTLIKTDLLSVDPRLGFELGYSSKVYLRGGLGQVQRIKNFDQSRYLSFQPNFGLGINLGQAVIDYALTDIGDKAESLYSHVFSIKVRFDALTKDVQ